MSTKKDFYDLLTYEERALWEAEYHKQNVGISLEIFLKSKATSFQNFLAQSFVFDLSEQGFDYWFNMSRSNRYLANWVDVYYNDVNIMTEMVQKGCRSIKMPLQQANQIAEQMLIQNLITGFVIDEPNSKIKFQGNDKD